MSSSDDVAKTVTPLWSYSQSKGELRRDGDLITIGYSGHGEGLNNPDLEHVRSYGPIPRGLWLIGTPYDSESTGPFTLPLQYVHGPVPHGRSAFRIHGDNRLLDRSASHGCIVVGRGIREMIAKSATEFASRGYLLMVQR